MAAVDEKEANMALIATDLDRQLRDRALPFDKIQIIAFCHPEEETRRLVGKAIVSRVLKSDEPEERKAAELSDVSTNEKYHMEAREDAGKALCGIIRKAGNWEKSYQIAMDARRPPETRAMAALDFLDKSDDNEGIAAILGCGGISEKVREEKGFRIVKDALEKGNRGLVERIGSERGLPPMLAICIRSIIGNSSVKPFARESVEPPRPRACSRSRGPSGRSDYFVSR